jgi:uncharacterized protein
MSHEDFRCRRPGRHGSSCGQGNAAPEFPGARLKFQPDSLEGVNAVSRLEAGKIWIHQTPFDSSLLVPWRGEVQAWPVSSPADLNATHFERLLAFNPELVIFGSGAVLKFIAPAHYRALIERRIGFETMDTAAACRTFNVLAQEGRKVVGALLLEPAGAGFR